MVAGVRELHRLDSLWLYGNRIGSVGCEALATLLADPNSNIHTLHLGVNQINTIGANTLFNSLKNNTKLKILYLGENQFNEKDVENVLSRILCNTTCVNETYSSNHTFEDLSTGRHHGGELNSLLDMNDSINKRHVAIKKILKYHLNIDMSPLFELDMEDEQNLKGLPYVVSWFKKAKEAAAYAAKTLNLAASAAKREKSVETKKLSALYQFARSMPMLFVPVTHTKVDDKKRKREDYVDAKERIEG